MAPSKKANNKASILSERLANAEANHLRWQLSGATGAVGLAFQQMYRKRMAALKRQILIYRGNK